jgi:predicted TPR repeat methyltransferase
LKKASELAPQRIIHHAELAHVYKAMGKSDLALQEWQNTLGLRAADSADEKYQQEARATLEAARSARGSSGTKFTTQR